MWAVHGRESTAAALRLLLIAIACGLVFALLHLPLPDDRARTADPGESRDLPPRVAENPSRLIWLGPGSAGSVARLRLRLRLVWCVCALRFFFLPLLIAMGTCFACRWAARRCWGRRGPPVGAAGESETVPGDPDPGPFLLPLCRSHSEFGACLRRGGFERPEG